MEFLLHEDTLTLACFPAGSSTPDELVSLPVDWENDEGLEQVRSKLLSMVEVQKYSPAEKITVATEVARLPDGFFEFNHSSFNYQSSESNIPDKVRISADELWCHDLRDPVFKQSEKNMRKRARRRWKSMSYALIAALILLGCYISVQIGEFKLQEKEKSLRNEPSSPLGLESQKLLEKLRQNKLGGIDPFGALGRVASIEGVR